MLPIVLTAALAPERRGGTSLPSAGLARVAKEVRSDRFDPAAFEWPNFSRCCPAPAGGRPSTRGTGRSSAACCGQNLTGSSLTFGRRSLAITSTSILEASKVKG